jgi:hypothetical protein
MCANDGGTIGERQKRINRQRDKNMTLYAYCQRRLCQFGKRYTRMVSYAWVMDDQTLRYRLEIPLLEKDYGNSAAEVLGTCALVAEYAREHTPDQIKAFQKKVSINPQVWLRLLALDRDERLKKHIEHLPPSYTALYAIHRMKDEEIDAAVQQGVITPTASSHTILSWAKQNRQRVGETIPPWRCLIVFDQEVEKKDLTAMRFRINEITREYGARFMSEIDYAQEDPVEINQKKQIVEELEKKVVELSTPFYERMTERERSNSGVQELENLLHLDVMTFGWITRPDEDIHAKAMRHRYTPAYVYKFALEFHKTDSRSQRFNYKRRLRDLAVKQPDLKELIDEVLETYMMR